MSTNLFDQFAIKNIFAIPIGSYNLTITNSALWMIIVITLIIALSFFAIRKPSMVPGRLQALFEIIFCFAENILLENCDHNPAAHKHLNVFFGLFYT